MKHLLIVSAIVLLAACNTISAKKVPPKSPIDIYELYHTGELGKQEKVGKDSRYWVADTEKWSDWMAGYAMKEGVFELPPLHAPRGRSSSGEMIVGRGPGKTVIKGVISVEEIRDLHFMNLTLDNVTLHLVTQWPKLYFYNVEVIGQIKTNVLPGNTVRSEEERKRVGKHFNFNLSTFHEEQELEKQLYREGDVYPIFIRNSRLKVGDSYVNYPSTRQAPDKLANLNNLTANENRQYIPGAVDGYKKWIFGEQKIDQKAFDRAVARANEEIKKGNYLVAQKFIDRAKEINFQRENENLKELSQKATKNFKKYNSCYFRYSKSGSATSSDTGNWVRTVEALKHLANETFPTIEQFTTRYTMPSEVCVVTAWLEKDLQKFDKSQEKLVSAKPIYEESEASKARKRQQAEENARAREAAKQAAWDAAVAKTNAIVDRAVSQTKFNYENRNRIESRADGTYLVLNNKTYQPPANLNYQQALKASESAQGRIVEGNTEYVLKGYQRKVSYYVEGGEVLKGKVEVLVDGKKKVLKLPDIDSYFSGRCEVDENTATRQKDYNGTCTVGNTDVDFRAGQFKKQFGAEYSALIKQMKQKLESTAKNKAASKDPATKLEGQLLADMLNATEKFDKGLLKAVVGQ